MRLGERPAIKRRCQDDCRCSYCTTTMLQHPVHSLVILFSLLILLTAYTTHRTITHTHVPATSSSSLQPLDHQAADSATTPLGMLPRSIRENPRSATPIDVINRVSGWVKQRLHTQRGPQQANRTQSSQQRSAPRGFRLGAAATVGGVAIGSTASNMSTSNGQTTDWKSVSDSEWKQRLTPEQFRILRLKDTEYPGTGEYNKTKDAGVYACAGCNTPLYTSDHKFESSCGWPAYFDAIPGKVKEIPDRDGMASIDYKSLSIGQKLNYWVNYAVSKLGHRIEIVCATCDGHLGHVFKGEGYSTPTDARHCVNSKSLKFNKGQATKDLDARYAK